MSTFKKKFNVYVIIQVGDDERFYRKGDVDLDKKKVDAKLKEVCKDVLSVGLDLDKTFVYSNIQYKPKCYKNILRCQKVTTVKESTELYKLNVDDVCSYISLAGTPIAACFPQNYPHLCMGSSGANGINITNKRCVAVYPMNLDGYYYLAREVSKAKLKEQFEPSCIVMKGLCGLNSTGSNMVCEETNNEDSLTIKTNCIFINDTGKPLSKKINQSFSGGQDTAELQREFGSNLDVDVPVKLIEYFHIDDDFVAKVKQDYKSGAMLSGECKKIAIEAVTQKLNALNTLKKSISDAQIQKVTKF